MGTDRRDADRATAGLSPILIGRDHELEGLLAQVDGIHEHGGALLLRGEAGIGKTALVSAASERARAYVSVFRTTGVQSETRLPFAGLQQLLLPFLDRI